MASAQNKGVNKILDDTGIKSLIYGYLRLNANDRMPDDITQLCIQFHGIGECWDNKDIAFDMRLCNEYGHNRRLKMKRTKGRIWTTSYALNTIPATQKGIYKWKVDVYDPVDFLFYIGIDPCSHKRKPKYSYFPLSLERERDYVDIEIILDLYKKRCIIFVDGDQRENKFLNTRYEKKYKLAFSCYGTGTIVTIKKFEIKYR